MNRKTKILLLVMFASMFLALYWDKLPIVKNTIESILNPTAGALLDWNLSVGMLVVVFCISLIISLLQKYTVDQNTLRELKKEQKILQEEIKKFKDHPEKLLELQKKQLEFVPKTFDLTLRPLIFTAIPIALFFRWFSDYFKLLPEPMHIFGIFSTQGAFIFPSWVWAYLLSSIIFSMIFRKLFKLA